MADDFRHWPLLLRSVAEQVGRAEALKLASVLGGQRITVPLRAAGSKLARLVGLPTAEVIVELYGGEPVPIPNFAARLAAERRRYVLTHPCHSANSIAEALGITCRRVEQIRSAARADDRQITMFDA